MAGADTKGLELSSILIHIKYFNSAKSEQGATDLTVNQRLGEFDPHMRSQM